MTMTNGLDSGYQTSEMIKQAAASGELKQWREREEKRKTTREIHERFQYMGIPDTLWRVTWDKISEGSHKNAVENFLRNAKGYIGKGAGFYIYGPTGVGKTSIAAIMLIFLDERHHLPGFLITTDQIRNAILSGETMSSSTSRREDPPREKVDDFIKNECPVLVIDDLGNESGFRQSDWGSIYIDNLLRTRRAKGLITIITSVLAQDKLKDIYFGRLPETIDSTMDIIQVVGESRIDKYIMSRDRYVEKPDGQSI